MMLNLDESVVDQLLLIVSHMSELPGKELLKMHSVTMVNEGIDLEEPTARSVRIIAQTVGMALAMQLREAMEKAAQRRDEAAQLIEIPTGSEP